MLIKLVTSLDHILKMYTRDKDYISEFIIFYISFQNTAN